ncbi:MAG: hypothetical protein PUB98_06550 [Clostridiales bacterium]|nr:hypothetical protein [Clostridiales bacterium]
MSISINAMASMMNTGADAVTENKADSLKSALSGVDSAASEAELLQVCKDFESYFVEEILKEVKKNLLPEDEDEKKDQSLAALTDFHMDTAIELMADHVVDEIGESFTQQLYEQMKRNYGIE